MYNIALVAEKYHPKQVWVSDSVSVLVVWGHSTPDSEMKRNNETTESSI
jgi:hypothetical protein